METEDSDITQDLKKMAERLESVNHGMANNENLKDVAANMNEVVKGLQGLQSYGEKSEEEPEQKSEEKRQSEQVENMTEVEIKTLDIDMKKHLLAMSDTQKLMLAELASIKKVLAELVKLQRDETLIFKDQEEYLHEKIGEIEGKIEVIQKGGS